MPAIALQYLVLFPDKEIIAGFIVSAMALPII